MQTLTDVCYRDGCDWVSLCFPFALNFYRTMSTGEFIRAEGGKKVLAGQAFVPEVYYNREYYPICGHHFWDSKDGATTVCKALGFTTGTLKNWPKQSSNEAYTKDAMAVGLCKPGEQFTHCSGGGNGWGDLDFNGGSCKKGKHVKIEVICDGK